MAANRTSISMTGCGIATRLAADRGAPIAAGENPHAAPTSVAAIKMREERTGIRDEGCHHSREASLSLGTGATCPTPVRDTSTFQCPPLLLRQGDGRAAMPHDHTHDERVYDEVRLDEMEYVEEDAMYYYQCPCGDMFELSEVCARRLSHHCALATHGCFFPLRSGAS